MMCVDYPTTLPQAVDRLLVELTDEQKEEIRSTPPQDLGRFHHSVGQYIRNEFGLWAGNDELLGESGNDRVDGQDGDDDLFGGKGNDRVVGGAGADELFGAAENDTVLARDNRRDVVECGRGTDTVFFDRGTDKIQGDCERRNP